MSKKTIITVIIFVAAIFVIMLCNKLLRKYNRSKLAILIFHIGKAISQFVTIITFISLLCSSIGVEFPPNSHQDDPPTETIYEPANDSDSEKAVESTASPTLTLPPSPTLPAYDQGPLRASKYEGSMSTYSNKPFNSADASSKFVEGDIVYEAEYAIDESMDRPWIEGAKGNGIGETLSLFFSEKTTVQVLEITLGYARRSDFYEKNNRPSHLRFQFSDGNSVECEFEDVLYAQRIVLNRPITTDWIKITILDVVLGTDNDTCIYLVKAYG